MLLVQCRCRAHPKYRWNLHRLGLVHFEKYAHGILGSNAAPHYRRRAWSPEKVFFWLPLLMYHGRATTCLYMVLSMYLGGVGIGSTESSFKTLVNEFCKQIFCVLCVINVFISKKAKYLCYSRKREYEWQLFWEKWLIRGRFALTLTTLKLAIYNAGFTHLLLASTVSFYRLDEPSTLRELDR